MVNDFGNFAVTVCPNSDCSQLIFVARMISARGGFNGDRKWAAHCVNCQHDFEVAEETLRVQRASVGLIEAQWPELAAIE